jgi:hypothetical protein
MQGSLGTMLSPRGDGFWRRDGDHRLVGVVGELVADRAEDEWPESVEAV